MASAVLIYGKAAGGAALCFAVLPPTDRACGGLALLGKLGRRVCGVTLQECVRDNLEGVFDALVHPVKPG